VVCRHKIVIEVSKYLILVMYQKLYGTYFLNEKQIIIIKNEILSDI